MIQNRGNTWRDLSHLIPSLPVSNEIPSRLALPSGIPPPVPVLSTTILQIELLLGESALDLAALSAVLLSDMGAVIQLFRASAADTPRPEDRTLRVGDCIASLGADTWFNAVSALPYVRERNSGMSAAAEHARTIAEVAHTIAPEFGLCPEESYVVGLLHEIHNLPSILGWHAVADDIRLPSLMERPSAPYHLQQELWQPEADFLPLPIAAALGQTLDTRTPSVWRRLLKDAHDLASAPPFPPFALGENKEGISPSQRTAHPRASASRARPSTPAPLFKPLQFLPRPPFLQPPASVALT